MIGLVNVVLCPHYGAKLVKIMTLHSLTSQGLADNSVISKVDGVLWDLDRPLEKSCSLQLLKFDDDEGKYTFGCLVCWSYKNVSSKYY